MKSAISFFLFLSLTEHAAASSLGPCSPIQVPLKNTTVTDQVSRRGIALQIGTPAQSLAFEAVGAWNNTYLFDSSSQCDGSDTPIKCAAVCGGFLVESSSSSWNQAANFGALGTASERFPDHGNDIPGNDTIHLNSTFSLPTFPLGINRGPGELHAMNTIGLGANSTLLNTLLSVRAIASRTWGLFHGWTGAESMYQMDGSLVLGGYDAAKVTGNNITIPFSYDQNCPSHLLVTISDIKMNLKNGSNPSIIGTSADSAFKACIQPDYPVITLNMSIWRSFLGVSDAIPIDRSLGINFFGMTISVNGSYDGDLTISIKDGLDIRIPNHQLVIPDVGFSEQGQLVINNGSVAREVLINSLQGVNQNDTPILGKAFLTSAYLLVDNDRSQFSLWSSNATTNQNLVAVGSSSCAISPPDPTSSSTSTTSTAPPVASSANPIEPSRPVPKGAIAGGVVGGLALVAFAAVAIILIARRRATRVKNEAAISKDSDTKPPPGLEDSGTFAYEAEMPVNEHTAQEMPLAQNQDYTLAPYEMPATRPRHELSS